MGALSQVQASEAWAKTLVLHLHLKAPSGRPFRFVGGDGKPARKLPLKDGSFVHLLGPLLLSGLGSGGFKDHGLLFQTLGTYPMRKRCLRMSQQVVFKALP